MQPGSWADTLDIDLGVDQRWDDDDWNGTTVPSSVSGSDSCSLGPERCWTLVAWLSAGPSHLVDDGWGGT